MSSFLKRHANQEEPDDSGDNEELYERLFPKIGRDYITRDEFEAIMQPLLDGLLVFGIVLPPLNSHKYIAVNKAKEYKSLLDHGKDGSKIYKDLVDLK